MRKAARQRKNPDASMLKMLGLRRKKSSGAFTIGDSVTLSLTEEECQWLDGKGAGGRWKIRTIFKNTGVYKELPKADIAILQSASGVGGLQIPVANLQKI